ncbi:hypothetical protein K439DRAFT_1664533 [Ramaria rubella]|nr:hypothetical protein K439DRAFT_1664533 [Ramaria rubella]
MENLQERPKKRARSQSPQRDEADTRSSQGVRHDPDYYFEDGSTVILVGEVLFKVHRTILSKDSSAFETMFKLPAGCDIQAEGTRDDNPVVMQGDTPEQFRSLLWALYALPHEVVEAGAVKSRVEWPHFDRFCDIALMVHKYCFKSLETWAIGTFLNWLAQCSRNHAPSHFGSSLSRSVYRTSETSQLSRLRRVLEIAVLCEDQKLRNTVVQRLQDELRTIDADLPWFIALGERFEIASLTGAAYYALMVQGRDKWIKLVTEDRLSRSQLGRLHNGYYALVSQWETYRCTPPSIQHCVHFGHCCKQRWHAYWKELTKDDIILAKFPADVVGRLETMLTQVFAYPDIMDMHQECRNKALGAVKMLISQARESLASHFVDLP